MTAAESTARERQCRNASQPAQPGAPPEAGGASGRGFVTRQQMALAAALLLGVLWGVYQRQSSTILQTTVGEQKSFTLEDGSVVFLNTESKISGVAASGATHRARSR